MQAEVARINTPLNHGVTEAPRGGADARLPSDLTGTQQQQPQVPQAPQAAPQAGQEQPGAQATEATEGTPTTDPAAAQEPQEITAIHLDKFGRDFSLMEVESAIEGFNYYHTKALKMQEDLQRVEGMKAEAEQARSSPEMVLTDALRTNPVFKEKVLALLSTDPQVLAAFNAKVAAGQQQQVESQTSQEIAGLKAELEGIKAKEVQAQQARWQEHVVSTVRAVDNAVTQALATMKADGIEFGQADLQAITERVSTLVQQQKLKYTPQDLTNFYLNTLNGWADKLRAARNQATSAQIQSKQKLHPAPIARGGAPALPQAPIKNMNDFANKMADRIRAATAQL
jgi:hypothetical protein